MNKTLQDKLLTKAIWVRGLFMLIFLVIKFVITKLISLIALFQFGATLLLGKPNAKLLEFTRHLNFYLLQLVNFVTFNSEAKPYPFTEWPEE